MTARSREIALARLGLAPPPGIEVRAALGAAQRQPGESVLEGLLQSCTGVGGGARAWVWAEQPEAVRGGQRAC